MWPWGHAAVAYLCYAGLLRLRQRRNPAAVGRVGAVGALAVVFGAQVPDLIDKPLAWTFAVLAHGRSLGHSLLVILPVLALLWWWLGDDSPEAVGAFGVGWLSHLLGDGALSVVTWELGELGFVLWPVTKPAPPEIGQSFLAHLLAFELDAYQGTQLLLVAMAFLVWRRDDYPGLATVRARLPASLGGTADRS